MLDLSKATVMDVPIKGAVMVLDSTCTINEALQVRVSLAFYIFFLSLSVFISFVSLYNVLALLFLLYIDVHVQSIHLMLRLFSSHIMYHAH